MVFSIQSTTVAAIGHLEITIIAEKEETATGQVKRQGNASTVFLHGIHPRRDCKQVLLQGDPSPYMQFNSSLNVLSFGARRTGWCYTTMTLRIVLCLSKRSWQNNRSPFCHTLHTHLILHHAIYFSFPA
jgi:hypothetical protein